MSIDAKWPDRATNQKVAHSSRAGRIIKSTVYGTGQVPAVFICDNLVTVVLRLSSRHSRDGVALAGIARIHIAYRGRDRGVTIFRSWFSSH
jgi:hypothetical protein